MRVSSIEIFSYGRSETQERDADSIVQTTPTSLDALGPCFLSALWPGSRRSTGSGCCQLMHRRCRGPTMQRSSPITRRHVRRTRTSCCRDIDTCCAARTACQLAPFLPALAVMQNGPHRALCIKHGTVNGCQIDNVSLLQVIASIASMGMACVAVRSKSSGGGGETAR